MKPKPPHPKRLPGKPVCRCAVNGDLSWGRIAELAELMEFQEIPRFSFPQWFALDEAPGLDELSNSDQGPEISSHHPRKWGWVTPENPILHFNLPFKVIFNVCIIKLAKKSMSHWKLSYKLWFSLSLCSLPVIVGETQANLSHGRCYSSPQQRSCAPFAS